MLTAAHDTEDARRSAVTARIARVREQTLALAAPLSAEDQLVQSMPDASPTKWHLAHTTWFFETFVLAPHDAGYQPFDPRFGRLFNSYYEAAGPRHPRPSRGLLSRPGLDDVHAYRAHVDAALATLIANARSSAWRAIAPLVELGLQHEQQHQELILTDIKHALAQNPLAPRYHVRAQVPRREAPPLTWSEFPGGLYEIGHGGEGFAFDNEGPRHKAWVEAFKLADRLVTNGEYAEFIADAGYERALLWLFDSWAVLNQQNWRAPLYWRGAPGEYRQFTLAGERDLDPSEPVCHLSYFEADAHARWAGKRLPREEEWEIAAGHAPREGRFASSGEFHPGVAADGALQQMFGDLWEWTGSPYSPYPGFRAASGALGEYNGKFMCGQFVLRGGAAVTPHDHIRPTYRNFFAPAARWAFAGLRLADDA